MIFGPLPSTPATRGRRRHVQVSRPIFTKPDDWSPCTTFPELHGEVAIDCETRDPGLAAGMGSSWPYPGTGYVCGWAFSWEGGDFYVPLAHSEGNVDSVRFYGWLRAQAAKTEVTFVYANAAYDLGWLSREGIEPANLPIDVQGLAALLDEFRYSYSLDSLGNDYLSRGKADASFIAACAAGGLNEPKSHMEMVPAWLAESYAVTDARLTLDLYHHLMPMIREQNLRTVLLLERECILVGVDMKRRGVRVDTDRAAQLLTEFERKRDAQLELVRRETGVACVATDNTSLARALRIENPALDLPLTSTGRDSIRKEVIEALRSPVANAINAARRYAKAINTFLQGYILETAVSGRIHADFNPLRRSGTDSDGEGIRGTASGRWSCTDPNLQNLPTRDPEIGDAVRSCFQAEEGEQWGKLDYASQEPRLAVHIAEQAGIRGAKEMADRFRADPNTDLHGEVGQMMSIPRGQAKTINLAILYGAGGAEICRRLGLPTSTNYRIDDSRPYEIAGIEGQRLINAHFQAFPFIKGLQEKTKAMAEARGWVKTIGGRKCHFQKQGEGYQRTYKACNSVIQGSAADQMKRAQIQLRRAGITPLVVVHDDCSVSVPQGREGERAIATIKDIMETSTRLSIPVVADVKIGDNWAAVR